jgi:hypothetical protein
MAMQRRELFGLLQEVNLRKSPENRQGGAHCDMPPGAHGKMGNLGCVFGLF